MARMSKRELLKLIAQAGREGWRGLDLGDKGLTELPLDVSRLVYSIKT